MPSKKVSTVEDFVGHIQLVDVKLVRFSAEPDEETEPGIGIRFNIDVTDGQLATIFAFRLTGNEYKLETEHIAVWEVDAPLLPSGQAMAEFAERVAFMTVYPYVREALSAAASRVGRPSPTLGLIRQGDVDLSLDVDDLEEFLTANLLFPSDREH